MRKTTNSGVGLAKMNFDNYAARNHHKTQSTLPSQKLKALESVRELFGQEKPKRKRKN